MYGLIFQIDQNWLQFKKDWEKLEVILTKIWSKLCQLAYEWVTLTLKIGNGWVHFWHHTPSKSKLEYPPLCEISRVRGDFKMNPPTWLILQKLVMYGSISGIIRLPKTNLSTPSLCVISHVRGDFKMNPPPWLILQKLVMYGSISGILRLPKPNLSTPSVWDIAC